MVLKVIGRDTNAPITVLDNRAATHTKLDNLQAALSDSHKMMRQDKSNCIVYSSPQSLTNLSSDATRVTFAEARFYS